MRSPWKSASSCLLLVVAAMACTPGSDQNSTEAVAGRDPVSQEPIAPDVEDAATFAGGCFWCLEKPFEQLPGVNAVISGYTGGRVMDPTYEQVCRGQTGHTEAVLIRFDPKKIRYEDLLEVLWRECDPTDLGGQFVDRGTQYRPEIFYHSEDQKRAAHESIAALQAAGRFEDPIVIPVTRAGTFFVAEEYHQDYYLKDPERYRSYREGSGRDQLLDRVWGEDRRYVPPPTQGDEGKQKYTRPSDAEIQEMLTPLQYEVTQRDGTERPFQNEFWDNKEEGLYVDIVTGEPLFSSKDKFRSGTGWPSFVRPIGDDALKSDTDDKLGYVRFEIRSKIGDSHLGHVFEDGPLPTGMRYCMNSASLRFIPKAEMEQEGYGDLMKLVGPPMK